MNKAITVLECPNCHTDCDIYEGQFIDKKDSFEKFCAGCPKILVITKTMIGKYKIALRGEFR